MQSSVKEAESKGTRNGERKRCWQHLKLSWESCATASYLHHYWPPLSLSVACVSVRLQASQSGSVTLCCFSSWLLLFSIPPSVPLLLCLLSYIFTPPPFFIPLPSFFFHFLSGLLVPYPRWTSHSWSYSLATDHLLLPSYSSYSLAQKEDKTRAKIANT